MPRLPLACKNFNRPNPADGSPRHGSRHLGAAIPDRHGGPASALPGQDNTQDRDVHHKERHACPTAGIRGALDLTRLGLVVLSLGLALPTDAGAQLAFGPVVNVSRTAGDSRQPHLAFGASGVLHVVWMDDSRAPGAYEIRYARSTNSGATFSAARTISTSATAAIRPRLATRGANVYVVWAEDAADAQTSQEKEIMFVRSVDAGLSFSAPLNLSNTAGHSHEARVGVDADGTVYVIWDEGTPSRHLALARSRSAGATFELPRTLFLLDAAGATKHPGLAVDPRTSAIYMTWHDNVAGEPQVFFSRSLDRGETFSSPLNISRAPLHAHCATPSVGPTGTIHVAFEVRKDASLHRHDAYYAQSRDGGATFTAPLNLSRGPDWAVSDYPWPAEGAAGLVVVGWEDNTRGGEFDAVVAVSTDGGRTFGASQNISNNSDSTSAEVVTLFGPDGALYALWEDYQAGRAEVLLRRADASGSPPPAAPAFSIGTASATPNPVAPGSSTVIQAAITDTGGPASGILIDLEIYRGTTRVHQQVTTGQSFSAGQTRTFQWTWSLPATLATGTYRARRARGHRARAPVLTGLVTLTAGIPLGWCSSGGDRLTRVIRSPPSRPVRVFRNDRRGDHASRRPSDASGTIVREIRSG
jgi:hypothetical protein